MKSDRLTLPKSRRIHHKTLLDGVFEKGKKITTYPLRMVWRPLTEDQLREAFCQHVPEGIGRVQILISVPKRKLRHAVDRVAMRRRIRESYRLNQHMLDETLEKYPKIRTISLAFVYMSTERIDMNVIQCRMGRTLEKLINDIDREGVEWER